MRRVLVTAVLLASLAAPAAACANGNPASDVLLTQDAFYPYRPEVPKPVQSGLDDTLERARKAGFPLKVAIIASQNDLGAIPQFYGSPQPYADHLETEIAFDKPKPLLVVMPTGFGVAAVSGDPQKALEDVDTPDGDSGDSLGRTAIEATRALAKAQGKPLPAPDLPPPVDEGGTSPIVYFIPIILLALGGGLAALRARQQSKDEEAREVAT
jgi:hypothetical protein